MTKLFDRPQGTANKIARSIMLLLLCTCTFAGLEAAEKVNIRKNYRVLEAENKVWLATPDGLFQYNSEGDSYKRFIIPGINDSQAVREIVYNDEWLWCILDSSVAALHIRLNEWLVFDESGGLPSNKITGIDFSDDYVYVSTTGGAARYDLFIEEWESLENPHLSGKTVNDVVVINDKVWFVTAQEISEYSPDFEKWRHFDISSDPELRVSQAYYYNDDIWLLSNTGVIQFNPDLQSFQAYSNLFLLPKSRIEIFTEDDNNWVISQEGLFAYGYESEMWNAFEANAYLSDKIIVNGYIDDSEIWIFTDRDVHIYDRSDKNWVVLDYASGLSSTSFLAGYVNGGMAFLISENSIEHRLYEDDNWFQYEIKELGHGVTGSARKLFKNLLDNEAGAYIPIGKRKWSWEGSQLTYILDSESSYYNDASSTDNSSGYRIDAKSQFAITDKRTISGYYNNIDYSETMYGFRYRSKENDLLRELNWGDYRYEPGEVPFGETASMFGTNIWLQTGKKTEKYKRSLVSLKAQTGQKRSKKHYEYISGALDKFSVTLEDLDYLKNQFYSIPYPDTTQKVTNIEIYTDDLTESNNTPNSDTKAIAGITGNFELLEATTDYYYYQKANAIRFTGYYNPYATIVMRYEVNNQTYEDILQRDSTISESMNNFYNLQASSIIPYSFKLSINDVNGTPVQLSEFGLDDNLDGRVDKEYLDYENGILMFPGAYPFPSDVYNEYFPQSSYVIKSEYETEYSLVQLEFNNLVREKETVKLDGVLAEGGADYVLDYTNGTLVFVKDGIVTPETRIEITYEYYLSGNYSQMHSASVTFSPSDNILVQADWLNFENDSGKVTNQLKAYSELRKKVGDFDVKLVPGAVYQAEDNKVTAYQAEGTVSSSRLRLQTKYQKFDEAYDNIYEPQSVVGQVKENLELNTSVDASKNIRLSGSLTDIKAFREEGSNTELFDKSRTASLLFHHQSLPGYEVKYANINTQSDTATIRKSFVQQTLEYQLPQKAVDKLPIQGMKVQAYLRNGVQSGQEIAGTDAQKFTQGNFKVNMNLGNQFQTSLFFRKNDLKDNTSESVSDKHLLTSERLLYTLSHEKWKVLQTNLRIENSIESYDYPVNDEYDLNLSQYTQLNFRLSPGAIWEKMSSLFFEFNINQSIYASGNSTENTGSYIWSVRPRDREELDNAQSLRTYFVKNEFRPNQNIYIYSLYEWNQQNTRYSLSDLYTRYWRLSEKFDAKLGYKTRLSLQYKQYYGDLGNNNILSYCEPSLWVERRWTSSFQNVLYANYRYTEDFEDEIKDYTHKYEARYDIIFRKKDFIKIRRLELQQSFSGGQTITHGYNTANFYNLGSSTSLNLYPLHSLILRLQFNMNKVVNTLDRNASYLSSDLNLRLSLRF